MPLQLRLVESRDVEEVVALGLRAWAPVHASMAAVLGEGLNARIYPEWAAEQAEGIRSVCADSAASVTVAVDGESVLGFVAVLVRAADATGEIDMIAVDPGAQGRGVGRALTDHAVSEMSAAGCTLAVVATGGDPGHASARALYESSGFTGLPLVRYYRRLPAVTAAPGL